jgi:hypothetical protein
MCNHDKHNNSEKEVFEKKYRLADFFNMHWNNYIKSPKEYIMPEQFKAVNAIRVCRTAALGVDIYTCPDCGEVSEVYHSCKNRFCPTCSWQDTVNWAERVKEQMLDLPHRHVVFTLPHSLNRMIKGNGKYLLNILMRTSADTFKDWISHKYGLKAGIITVLHTYGEKKDLHYHVHMIISWGGIDSSTGLLRKIKGEYVNYDFLKNKFRCKFEDSLVEMYDSGELISNFENRVDFMRFLRRINKKNWMLHLEPPMEVPSLVIRYIGRYSKRACLSEYKITKMEGGYISFRYKDYKNLDIEGKPIERELALHYSDFFPRLLQHVPLPYFRIVRYYGAYSNRGEIPKEYLYKETAEESCSLDNYKNVLYCGHCKRDKEYQYTIIEKRWTKDSGGAPTIIVYKRVDWFKRKAA